MPEHRIGTREEWQAARDELARLRHKHRHASWKWLRRHYLPGWWPSDGKVILLDIGKVTVTRYRYRATIPTPWPAAAAPNPT